MRDDAVTAIAKTKTAKAKKQNHKGEISSSLIEQGTKRVEKSQNGIPKNPKCKWSYKVLTTFYHEKLLLEIKDLESAIKGALARCSDRGEDGSNGTEELFSNSKANNVAETLEKVKEEASQYEGKRNFLLEVKRQIEAGIFTCKCDYETFYIRRVV